MVRLKCHNYLRNHGTVTLSIRTTPPKQANGVYFNKPSACSSYQHELSATDAGGSKAGFAANAACLNDANKRITTADYNTTNDNEVHARCNAHP